MGWVEGGRLGVGVGLLFWMGRKGREGRRGEEVLEIHLPV